MDSKPKTEYKDFSPQVVPDHTPEAAITQYFLSKYERRLSKYVSTISFQVFTAVCVQVIVTFWCFTLCGVVLCWFQSFGQMYCCFWNSKIALPCDKFDLLFLHAEL
jgi:hypothetical protein